MKVILDTSFLIELKKSNMLAVKVLEERKKTSEDILVSSLTIFELLSGAHYLIKKHKNTTELKIIQNMLQFLTEAIIDSKVTWKAAETRAELMIQGISVPDIDLLIACSEEAEVLTFDKDFEPLKELGFNIQILQK